MRLDAFDYQLPPERIAQSPAEPRDTARLLRIVPPARFLDHTVADLPDLLRPGDLLVVNDTRVLPTRLHGRRGTAGIEVTLHKAIDEATWRAFAKPARKLQPGDRLEFATLNAELLDKAEGGEVTLRFDHAGAALLDALKRHGQMPLPPYIKRDKAGDPRDLDRYQTLFAAKDGAVAAPTASLHFTPELLAAIRARGVELAAVTLHVGAGTFLPVKVEDIHAHVMHEEWCAVPQETAQAIAATRAAGRDVVAVGTTVLRTLESLADATGAVQAGARATDLFITPGYRFKVVDRLLSNFHLPRSTLLMLVAAFSGLETVLNAYQHAIQQSYRFFSYGDACLLERAA